MGRRGHRLLIGGFLVVFFAGHGRSQRDDFVGVFVHQEEVVVRMGFLLAAVLLLLLGGIGGLVATRLASRSGASPRAAKARGKTGST